MYRMKLFQEIELCLDLLEGRMGEEKTEEFLRRQYTDPIPEEWREMLRSRSELLSDGSKLYRQFWYAGLRDREEMETMVLSLFYLRYHVSRLP